MCRVFWSMLQLSIPEWSVVVVVVDHISLIARSCQSRDLPTGWLARSREKADNFPTRHRQSP